MKTLVSNWPGSCFVGWLLLTLVSMGLVYHFKSAAGEAGSPWLRWPEDCELQRSQADLELLIFVHPCCPCTRASLHQLARFLAEARDRFHVQMIVYQPSVQPEDWDMAPLQDCLRQLPRAKLVWDRDGREAERFQVSTSGHILVYNRQGDLRFTGGHHPCPRTRSGE